MSMENCILWNKLENPAKSQIGINGSITGTLSTTAVKFCDGKGTTTPSNYITFSDTNFNKNSFIVEYWFKPLSAVTNGASAAITLGHFDWYASNNDRIIVFNSGTGQYFYVIVGSTSYIYGPYTTGITWTIGSINHMAHYYNFSTPNGIYQCYLNGNLVANTTKATASQTGTGNLHFLVYFYNNAANQDFNSYQDNVKIYSPANLNMLKQIVSNRFIEGFGGQKRRIL